MIGYARIALFALIFAAVQIVLASVVVDPAVAQNVSAPKGSSSEKAKTASPAGTAVESGTKNKGVGPRVSDPNPKKKLQKPDSSLAKGRERACGNGQCNALWQEMTHPHDGRYQARLKVEKAYRDCMAKCVAAPQHRM